MKGFSHGFYLNDRDRFVPTSGRTSPHYSATIFCMFVVKLARFQCTGGGMKVVKGTCRQRSRLLLTFSRFLLFLRLRDKQNNETDTCHVNQGDGKRDRRSPEFTRRRGTRDVPTVRVTIRSIDSWNPGRRCPRWSLIEVILRHNNHERLPSWSPLASLLMR